MYIHTYIYTYSTFPIPQFSDHFRSLSGLRPVQGLSIPIRGLELSEQNLFSTRRYLFRCQGEEFDVLRCSASKAAGMYVCMYVCVELCWAYIHTVYTVHTYSTYIHTLMIRIRWTPMYVLLFDICKYSVGAIFNVCNVCM